MTAFIKRHIFLLLWFLLALCYWHPALAATTADASLVQTQVITNKSIDKAHLHTVERRVAAAHTIETKSPVFVFVDTLIDNYPILVKDIQDHSINQNINIIYLDRDHNGVQQITDTLVNHTDVAAIHLLTHGMAGSIQLGNAALNQNTIDLYRDNLIAWRKSLSANADILIYGCNVAATDAGLEFIEKIANLTQASVAASTNLTGATSLGGDWNLESRYGKIESNVILSAQAQQSWNSTLAYTDYIFLNPGSANTQTFTATSNVGSSFTITNGNSFNTISKIAVQLKILSGAATQNISTCIRVNWNSTASEKCATISSTVLTTNFAWYVFDVGNFNINDGVTYYIQIYTLGTDAKVAVNYSNSSIWNNNTNFYYNNNGGDSSKDMYFALSSGSNSTPYVNSAIPDQTASEGVAFSYTFSSTAFKDNDTRDSLTYSATLSSNAALPAWLTFNASTRTFSGTPSSGDVGTISVKVTANDGNSGTITDTFDIVVTSNLSYYRISHTTPGVTCAGSAITISAYNASNALVAPANGTVVTLSTSPATGSWVGGNTATFNGVATSVTKYLQQTTASTLNINVTDGTHTESASYDPSITFDAAALTFYGSTGLIAMQNEVAGTADTAPIIKAASCASQVTGAKNVSFGYECRNPTTCVAGQTLSVNSNNIQSNSNGASITYSAAQSLTFDGSGIASIPLNYSDVGKVKIYATMTLAASGNDPAITLTGNSGDIVVKPYTLVANTIQTSAAVANPGGTSTSGAASGFVAAGDAFTVKVEARNSAGNRTPNFGNETSTENNITFVPQALSYPSGGTLTTLTNPAAFTATTPAGTFINSTVSWNQVGSFTARPELADNDYLGAGDLASKTTTGTIGRFYPDHFTLASSSTSNSCVAGGFSFLNQPGIGLNYVLQAKSSTNTTVTNYGSTYGAAQAAVSYVAENNNGADGATYTSRLSDGASPAWVSGVMTVASSTASVLRKLTTFAPDGPFTSLQWGLVLTESFDGGRSLSGKNMNALTTGTCSGGTCTAMAIGSPLVLRYGRLRLEGASGPETASLLVNFLSEYWTGNYFALNSNDSCTIVPLAAITYPSGTLATAANFNVPLSIGTTTGTYVNSTGGVHFNAGTAGHSFSKPSAAGTGSFVVGISLSTLSWLRYDWNQDGTYSDTSIPNATYTFGTYRGSDRIIYWHERL
ncbi:MAG TPA: DUF6701 domain-containing protein [Cellvibrio sp.]|nr:DUF6701 domain-containing protein [Cellvibrio sp.]